MIDLANPDDRKTLAAQIKSDIDIFCQSFYENDHRKHLGASQMAKPCWRHLWYVFRWAKKPDFDGRMLRLFNVGHTAETRFIAYLRGIGFEVKEFDEDGKQFRINGAKGHYGGSLDGLCKPPARYEILGDMILLNEFKTNGTGSGYTKVSDHELFKAKPEHWGQMCQYGFKKQIRYGLYMIENKNDSDITIKIVELDWNLGAQLERKAEEIILAQEAPNKISENPAFFDCTYCHFSGICHGNEVPEKNCRSCRQAMPTDNGTWTCSRFNSIIPEDFIKQGCADWNAI